MIFCSCTGRKRGFEIKSFQELSAPENFYDWNRFQGLAWVRPVCAFQTRFSCDAGDRSYGPPNLWFDISLVSSGHFWGLWLGSRKAWRTAVFFAVISSFTAVDHRTFRPFQLLKFSAPWKRFPWKFGKRPCWHSKPHLSAVTGAGDKGLQTSQLTDRRPFWKSLNADNS